MSEERRHDYISLKELFEGKIRNEDNISHMKDSIDEIKTTVKEFVSMYADDKKKINSLEIKMGWLLKGIAAFFTGMGGLLLYFKTKLIALLTLL